MNDELIRRQDAIDAVAKMYRYESERMTALQNVPVVEPKPLTDLEVRDIVSSYEKRCNKEDILEASELTDEEKANEGFVERVNQIYTELRNSAPDWNRYLSDAIDQVRKEYFAKGENLATLYKKIFDLRKSARLIEYELNKVIPCLCPYYENVVIPLVSNEAVERMLKILEEELHKEDSFLNKNFFLLAPNRSEAFRKLQQFEDGYENPENPYLKMSYEVFGKELDKRYGKSEYTQIARMYEDTYGLVWYDGDYVG